MSYTVRSVLTALQGVILLVVFGVGVYQWIEGTTALAVPLIGISLLGGAGAVYAFWMREPASDNGQELSERKDAPWTVRPEWRTRTLVHENDVEWSSLVGPLIGNLFAWPAGGGLIYLSVSQPDAPLWLVLIGLITIGAFGVYPLWVATRKVLRQYTFRETRLELDRMPARLGQPFRADLYVPISPDAGSGTSFSVEMACKRRYTTKAPDPSKAAHRTTEERTVTKWVDEIRVEGRSGERGEGMIEVPISLPLPADQPPSTPEKKKEDRILWTLTVTASIPGVDYKASFEIPVFQPDDPSGTKDPVEPDREPAVGASLDEGPKEAVDEIDTLTESDMIHVEGRPEETLRVGIDAGGDLKIFGPPLLLGAVLGAVGIAVSPLGWMRFVFAGIAALLLYVGLRQYTYTGEVTVDNGSITVQSGAFGIWKTRTIPCSHLEEADVHAMGGVGSFRNYVLHLETAGTSQRDGPTRGRKTAEQVFENINATGAREMMKKTRDDAREIKVAEALDDKPAADHAANLITEAAEHQAAS